MSPLSPAACQQKMQQSLAICAHLCSSFVLMLFGKGERRLVRLSRSRSARRAFISFNRHAPRAVGEIQARTADRRLSQPRRFGRRDRGAGRRRREADARGDPRPPDWIRGLARRMPHPPKPPDPSPGVVAIQLSRLNEALLVAYSAMAPTNLKAVDQVVKIVRELDRYGGAFAAEWRAPRGVAPRHARRRSLGVRGRVGLRGGASTASRRIEPGGRRAPGKLPATP